MLRLVTGLDWIIIAVVLLLALFGWAQGFVAGALALAGFALGAWIGTRVAPLLLPEDSRWGPVFGLLGALFAGAVFASGFEGLGSRLRATVQRLPGLSAVDGVLGAVLTACVGVLVVWVLGAVGLHAGGELRRSVQKSEILRRLNEVLPPTGSLLNTLERLDPFPRIEGPEIDVPPPTGAIVRDPDVRRAGASVVKILGTACGLGVEGSGWVAEDGVVVTNAHVVAGQLDTRVLPGGAEPGLDAQAIAFDPRNDLAVLRVPGLGAPALALDPQPRPGAPGAILGYPRNGPFDVRAGRLGPEREAFTQDAYGRGPVRRRIVSLRGAVRSGNSGGPMVDGEGEVLTTVFAATTSGPRGGYGVPNDLVRRALRQASDRVSTGPCAG
jgi:S1-C subfamily serine protease